MLVSYNIHLQIMGFKQVQIAYLVVISNLDKLVQPCYILPMQIRLLARPSESKLVSRSSRNATVAVLIG